MILRIKGGPGSGHHGHKGRPGIRGGSLPGKGGSVNIAGHVKKVLKVAYKGELVEPNRNELGVITNYMKRHPASVVSHVEGIILCGSEEDWKAQYDTYFDDGEYMSCGGFYAEELSTGKHVVVLPPGFSEHAIDHELGHVAYRAASKVNGELIWRDRYSTTWFDKHTAYSRTDAGEGFAESYAAWISAGRITDITSLASALDMSLYSADLDRYYQTFRVVEEVVNAIR